MTQLATPALQTFPTKTLPPGWRLIPLAQLYQPIRGVTFQSGESKPLQFEDSIACITTSGVQDKLDWGSRRFIPLSRLSNESQVLRLGDIVVSTANSKALVGKSCLVSEMPFPCTFGAFVTVFRPTGPEIDSSYMAYWLRSPETLAYFYEVSANTTNISNLRVTDILALEIPLPPLDEQQRIAARLNEQMAAVVSARRAAESQLRAARKLPAGYLREVFDGEDVKKWIKKRLADVGEIGSGITLGRKLIGVKTRKVPYLRVANVKDGYLDLSDVYTIDATDADVAKCSLKYGDLLLTEGGDPDKLGRGTFWEEQIPECLHQNHIFRVRFDLNRLFAKFMAYQIGSPYGKAYFLAHAKQTTGIATINQKVLGNFPLLIPPFQEQERIANSIHVRLQETEKLRSTLETQLAEINQLPAALLRQAFSGGLS